MKYLVFILGNIDIAINIVFWILVFAQVTSQGKKSYWIALGTALALVIVWPSKELWTELLIK